MEAFLADMQFSQPDESSAHFVRRWPTPGRKRCPSAAARAGAGLAEIFADSPRDLGYFYEPDQTNPSHSILLVRVYEKENSSSLSTASGSVEAIRAAVRAEAEAFPQFRIGLTGRPVLDADEMRTSDTDSHRSETIALAVVFLGLVLLLRSIWLAVVAEVSLAVAIGWTFGWATLSVRELNLLSTVFLIALIGIGMDYLIQILAAYRREARRYVPTRGDLGGACSATSGRPSSPPASGRRGRSSSRSSPISAARPNSASSPAADCSCVCWPGTPCCRRCWCCFP